MTSDPDELLTVKELAAYLKTPEQSVYQMKHKGTGPRSVKVGRHLRFRRRDVEAWLEAHAGDPTPAA